jgi:hypothetical protein
MTNIRGLYRLSRGLPAFLREKITIEQGQERIKVAIGRRETEFLELIRSQVYAYPDHPYLKLFKYAGCEFFDLQQQVRRHGVENTLEKLAREGVYLTSEEFKGKKEVVRGGKSFWVIPSDLEPRRPNAGFAIQSSGTKNRPVGSFISLDWLGVRAWAMGVFFSAHGLLTRPHALYDAVLPGSAVNHLLINARLGRATERWFACRIPFNTRLAAFYDYLTTYLIVLEGKQVGVGLPMPEFTDAQYLQPIVLWAEQKRREGKPCQVTTIVSSAVRIAQTAATMGLSLDGVKFVVSGEPFTEAKRKVIEQAGSVAIPHYAYGGGINAGFACADAEDIDEIHVNQHMLALIPHPEPLFREGVQIHPLLCSTLRLESPRLLLNVENGDYGTLRERVCGCSLGAVGLNVHLSHIRSYEKFTSEAMNYFYGDLFNFMEQILPDEFGGGPGSYQLVEEEDGNGQTRLSLLVHPNIENVNEETLLSRLVERFGQGSGDNRLTSKIWQDAGTFRIKRQVPHASGRGKILPLHVPR